jgi:hypothetical protein
MSGPLPVQHVANLFTYNIYFLLAYPSIRCSSLNHRHGKNNLDPEFVVAALSILNIKFRAIRQFWRLSSAFSFSIYLQRAQL